MKYITQKHNFSTLVKTGFQRLADSPLGAKSRELRLHSNHCDYPAAMSSFALFREARNKII